MSTSSEPIRLTQYSHGAGCGCKISPKVLDEILKSSEAKAKFPMLLVGNESKDDAAVYDLGDGTGIISTTDFFMPIVDDAADFGTIASVNAISDVYAMGGTPLMAIAVLGWPVNTLPAEVANTVLEGSRRACAAANIPLAGGHSIDAPEPIFGLAVTGRVDLKNLKRNDTAKAGASLFLTKPLGIGVLTTAEKKSLLLPEHKDIAAGWMMKLNSAGAVFGKLGYVCAMTDVTGFGLLGHLCEMCEGSKLSATVEMGKIPVIAQVPSYIEQKCMPGGTTRNWDSYGHKIQLPNESMKWVLADPQTSGGLLVAVESGSEEDFKREASALNLSLESFGTLHAQQDFVVKVL